jgi:signal transduction histidine kinase
MTGTDQPHLWLADRGGRPSASELTVLALLVANLVSMEMWPKWDLLPLHLTFVGLTLAYCSGAWGGVGRTLAVVIALVGTAAIWTAERGDVGGAEQMETVLLTVATVAAIWRTEVRLRARRRWSDLSHEVLTAMTVIRGHIELLGRREPPSDAEIQRVREVVIAEVERMTGRIDGEERAPEGAKGG